MWICVDLPWLLIWHEYDYHWYNNIFNVDAFTAKHCLPLISSVMFVAVFILDMCTPPKALRCYLSVLAVIFLYQPLWYSRTYWMHQNRTIDFMSSYLIARFNQLSRWWPSIPLSTVLCMDTYTHTHIDWSNALTIVMVWQ